MNDEPPALRPAFLLFRIQPLRLPRGIATAPAKTARAELAAVQSISEAECHGRGAIGIGVICAPAADTAAQMHQWGPGGGWPLAHARERFTKPVRTSLSDSYMSHEDEECYRRYAAENDSNKKA